jgi:hypothetical protein
MVAEAKKCQDVSFILSPSQAEGQDMHVGPGAPPEAEGWHTAPRDGGSPPAQACDMEPHAIVGWLPLLAGVALFVGLMARVTQPEHRQVLACSNQTQVP